RDIASTLSVLEGPDVEGIPTRLEVAAANHDPDNPDYTARHSTGSSGIWNNKMQTAEHAMRASDGLPNFLYVTAPGQGGSSDWTPEEKEYIKKTGRFMQPDGTPLPSTAAKQAMLEEAGLHVTRLSSDADGAAMATGYAVAMEPGQLTYVHFNSPPITSDSGLLSAAVSELVNQYDDWRTGRVSEDPARLTDEMIAAALESLPERPREIPAQATKWDQARTTHTPGRLSIVAAGISRRRGEDVHPAAIDTAEMAKVHPEAAILLQVVKRSMTEGELRGFMEDMLRQRQTTEGVMAGANVSAVYIPGTRRMHKAYPTVRESIRRFAFDEVDA
ncbi:MAG: hypothetical protein ACREJM_14595, partial [Candidatus Saccharimonadales bacterium]